MKEEKRVPFASSPLLMKPILKRKLENMVYKKWLETDDCSPLRSTLKNIRVNGKTRGCSGHFTNEKNGICVYVDTEPFSYSSLAERVLVRFAENERDYSSTSIRNGYNQWVSFDDLPGKIVSMLQNGN